MKQIAADSTQNELLLCVPGTRKNRSDFVRAVISETIGEFMFAGMMLANPRRKDHVPLDFVPHDPQMRRAFELAGQRKLPVQLLDRIGGQSQIVPKLVKMSPAGERPED